MTWAAALRFWPAIPVLLLGLWVARLDHLRAGYREKAITCASGREVDRANAERDAARTETAHVQRVAAAAASYADQAAARDPIIIRSTDTVRTYAQTDAGRARCLGPDRVRGIAEDRAALHPEDTGSPARGADAVPAGDADDPG